MSPRFRRPRHGSSPIHRPTVGGCAYLDNFVGREFREGRSGAPPLTGVSGQLLLVNEVPAAILLPAGFVFLHAERLFFAEADGLDTAGRDSGGHQRVFH